MVLKTFDVTNCRDLTAEPLTPENFAPFGGVISADHQIGANQESANYGTAIKVHDVTPVDNNYGHSSSTGSCRANWSIFRCSAPHHLIQDKGLFHNYTSKVLERHPFTTQTFVPMGQCSLKVSYIVIVAQSDPNSPENLPDPNSLKAFTVKGNQAVTYGAGTWHAPMVVIDEQIPHIDFAVFQYENGVANDDCQECYFEPGYTISYKSVGIKN
jgi:ureidoglycolate lyase